MEIIIRIALPTYMLLYFGVVFVARSVIVGRRVGKSPFVFPKDDSAYALVGRYFKLTILGLFVYVIWYSAVPMHLMLRSLSILNQDWIKLTGLALMMLSFIWTVIAQLDMHNSWRIGIDHEIKTELITTGVFRLSRNPVFLGMIAALTGLLLATPNGFTVMFLLLAYILIQVQIRLEEEHLAGIHGEVYMDYKRKVRRLL